MLSFKLEDDLYRVLKLVAAAQGKPVSVVIRDALRAYLREVCDGARPYVGKYLTIYTPITPETCGHDGKGGGGHSMAAADVLRDPAARLKRLGAASLARRAHAH